MAQRKRALNKRHPREWNGFLYQYPRISAKIVVELCFADSAIGEAMPNSPPEQMSTGMINALMERKSMNDKIKFLRSALALVLLPAVTTATLYGQSYRRAPRISIWITRSLVKPRQQSLYHSSYSPPFEAGEYSSDASQALSLKARDAAGTSVGAAVGLNRIFNVVFQVDWSETDLTGVNSPYMLSLSYMSMPPPDYTPQTATYVRNMEWPDTEGWIKHLSISLNLQARFRLIRMITLDISAGLTYFSLKGKASSLAFDNFWLGGHSVLFSNHFRLRTAFGPRGTVGGNMGIGLEIPLIRPLYLYFGGQLFLSPKLRLNPEIDLILNSREIIKAEPLEKIQAALDLHPMELNPGRLQLLFGVRLRI